MSVLNCKLVENILHLSSSDEFHEKKLENIKSDIQKEITTIMKDQIKEAINEAFQGKKMMGLVNDCVLNLNNKESIQETECKPVDATQFEVLNDPTGNLGCIDVSEDDCEEDREITEKMIKPSAASSKRQWGYGSDEEEDNLHNLIAGNSIVQGIDEQLFHKGKNNKVVSLRGKGIEQVRKFLEDFHGKDPQTIIIHVGSNDLTKDSPEAVNRAFESLVEYVKHKFINSKILISFPLQRVDNIRFNENLDKFTRLLRNVCNKNHVSYIASNNLGDEWVF